MNIHERIDEMVGVAKLYAEDGAFRTAAKRFRELADELDAHAAATEVYRAPAGMGKTLIAEREPIRKRVVNTSSRDKLLKRYKRKG